MAKRERVDLTEDEIMVWAENLGGKPVSEIAKDRNIPLRTAYNWLNRAKETIGTHDVEEMRACLFSLFPDALDAVHGGLRSGKPSEKAQIGLRLLSGLAVLSEKREIDLNDKKEPTTGELVKKLKKAGVVVEAEPAQDGENQKEERAN